MANNREILAKKIVERFSAAISGTDQERWVNRNPEDVIYIGKLSPETAGDSFSSNVLIRQISVDFKILKEDLPNLKIKIYPQGNFFYRVMPTLEEQRKFFLEEINALNGFEYTSFETLVKGWKEGSEEIQKSIDEFKTLFLPIFEKLSLERDNKFFEVDLANIYDESIEWGFLEADHPIHKEVDDYIEGRGLEIKEEGKILRYAFREKVRIKDIETEEAWARYIKRASAREEFDAFPKFAIKLDIEARGTKDAINIRVSLGNDTTYGDESGSEEKASADKYRINTLFNSGIIIEPIGADLSPIELEYFADDYKYDKKVYALGNNCNVEVNDGIISTTHLPLFIQHRLKTNDRLKARFLDLVEQPVETLMHLYTEMQKMNSQWESEYEQRKEKLTVKGREQFKSEIKGFKKEIERFKTGISLIRDYNIIRDAFCFTNQAFYNVANGKYDSWRLFQIVFIVSLILDIVAHEADLELEEELKDKAKTNYVDVLYFPTGGGKTEAFLGIMVFNLFFDRLRHKNCGVTSILKYPLRLLSIQQVQRVANILAAAELIRKEKIGGAYRFSLGYYTGDMNSPNKIESKLIQELIEYDQETLDKKFRVIDVCPYCKNESIHVSYVEESNRLMHICDNPNCSSGGVLPLYIVDNEIYRYLPSVIISTVDKMAAIGNNRGFHNLLCGADKYCPKHGYTEGAKCASPGCNVDINDFKDIEMKDPAPTLLIQDELHLIRESLGVYDAHYETFIDYFIKKLSGSNRGVKVIGATATISEYKDQAYHLFYKDAIRFPCASPNLKENFYSYIDEEEVNRIILGYAPFGKAIVNSVAYSIQYLRKIIYDLYIHPEQILTFKGIELKGNTEEEKIAEAKRLMDDYWVILEYNNVKMDSNKVLNALDDPINTELVKAGIEPLVARKMTGDDTFQDVRTILSQLEHAETVEQLEFNMITATSMISHGVDADRFNLMFFYGMPGNTAEYIQAYSRVGRKHPGIVIDIMRPAREKDQSYLKNFVKFHEYKDILVESVPINRWATRAIDCTLPGIVSGLILNYYMYKLEDKYKDLYLLKGLRKAIHERKIDKNEIKMHLYQIYRCESDEQMSGREYKRRIDVLIDSLFDGLLTATFDSQEYITTSFKRLGFRVMTSLRDTDKQLIVELS